MSSTRKKRMTRSIGSILCVIYAALGLLLLGCRPGAATSTETQPAQSDGTGVFAEYVQRHGGPAIFGDPLTDPFPDPDGTQTQLQYYTNALLQYDEARRELSRFPLGRWEYGNRESGSDFQIDGAFLTFYDTVQGNTAFGEPISGVLEEQGVRVQYFEYARLEWQPSASRHARIVITPLGSKHFYESGAVFSYERYARALPVSPREVGSVAINGALGAPILYDGEQQTIFVNATSLSGRPVTDLSIDITVVTPAFRETIPLGVTDIHGAVQESFQLEGVPAGTWITVIIEASSPGSGVIGTDTVQFRTWW